MHSLGSMLSTMRCATILAVAMMLAGAAGCDGPDVDHLFHEGGATDGDTPRGELPPWGDDAGGGGGMDAVDALLDPDDCAPVVPFPGDAPDDVTIPPLDGDESSGTGSPADTPPPGGGETSGGGGGDVPGGGDAPGSGSDAPGSGSGSSDDPGSGSGNESGNDDDGDDDDGGDGDDD